MVSADTQANPLGAIIIGDFGNPGILTGVAQTVLSGGELVQAFSGTATLTGSDAASFDTSDLIFQRASALDAFNGIVTQNAGSNTRVSVATKGLYLMKAGEIVSGGFAVCHNGSGGVQNQWDIGIGAGSFAVVGRALQSIASGTDNYGVIQLGL